MNDEPPTCERAVREESPRRAGLRGRRAVPRSLAVGLALVGVTLLPVPPLPETLLPATLPATLHAVLGLAAPASDSTRAALEQLFGTAIAHADIYEFVDAEGVAHYTNVPAGQKSWRKVAFEGRRSRVLKTPAEQRDRSPARYSRYDAHLLEAARLYQLPVALLRAVLHVESDFDPNVVSVDGAMGLMQLMPFTAQKMGVDDPFDPRQNILGGARFLRILANQWNGDLVKTVASYNAGAGAVERYRGVPPYGETRRYVNRVLTRYYAYRSQTSG